MPEQGRGAPGRRRAVVRAGAALALVVAAFFGDQMLGRRTAVPLGVLRADPQPRPPRLPPLWSASTHSASPSS